MVVDRDVAGQRGSRPGSCGALPDVVHHLQQLLIGKEVTVRIGDHDVVLTVTELDSALEPQGLAVGQLGEVRVAARGISWDQHHLHSAVAVLRNVHIRPGVPPLVIAAPVELSSALPTEIFDDVLRQATPQLRGELSEAERPGCAGRAGPTGEVLRSTSTWRAQPPRRHCGCDRAP